MTRALANLLQKTRYDFDAEFVARMLGVFEEQLIELHESTAQTKLIGWNFEGAPNPGKPAVWVTAVSVLALDRIVRMLNTRINEIVLAHFDVSLPKRPHTGLTLCGLIYSDGLTKAFRKEEGSTAIQLQKARAHVMRATLPKPYRKGGKGFSTIYYGPPRTGKTTLAESLALSAEVPLLRLSPGDLILQGQEMIEGRAHDVFESLSMLTQCVIIFDEFEPVLTSRSSRSDDAQFRFVLGGMLPKLIKLHDSAGKQSFAYYLGTNCINDIDAAAKRPGRFDQKIPVYKPDPLSRAGALLYGLSQSNRVHGRSAPELQRFYEVIARTIGEPADRISRLFTIEHGREGLTTTLDYILGSPKVPDDLKESKANLRELKSEILTKRSLERLDKEEREKEQREWIYAYEKRFLDGGKHFWEGKGEPKWDEVFVRLSERLEPPTTESIKKKKPVQKKHR
ncbi:MAG: ATP-binding protein [Chthoniobacterales bacterium]